MVNNDMTAQNLRSAYAGESMAYQRYKIWGQKAAEEGFENVALLFDAIAYAEEVHAGNHFAAHENVEGGFLVAGGGEFGLGTTSENLVGAIEGEEGEVEQMYPTYSIVAKEQGESDAVRSFHYALEAEQIHAKLYRDAKEHVDNGEDIELEYVSICEVCGHTVVDGLPEKCPVCGEPSSAFRKFTK
ncbi:rubrerythrin family protein [Halanaerobium congolense]|jgi:rubrerythrin|uniref:Rubrerythrin n=1 Tax=Halanaerobium congolense TaxID=54121 RepID=A0A1G6JJ47_9FIRM|nr:rubrerythrin family protein [Halanaerobium congolense]KXS48321.1 MAG: rubrerythrin [Halanaerobium sp. T82-1]OEG63468.1 MAG: Rubrerythrin-2 [Halanaerobium sp. MDAL1]PUU93433.1 MAG: rubrerythrin [Halanaerobium sp.]PXV65584.1 rubrerythrin [Halanaerobium congolense]TDP25877.1 rubrerythrin [Halanaerobium congolense]